MDKQLNTGDDWTVRLFFRRNKVVTSSDLEKSEVLPHIEHDRGPNNERAEISGTVVDPTGAAVSNAFITAKNISTGHSVTIHANAEGKFQLTGLRTGNYQVDVSSPGFRQAEGAFRLEPRDRAELGVQLMVAATTQTVEVTGASVTIETGGVVFGMAGGVAGGVAGGSMGGVIGGVICDRAGMRVMPPGPPQAPPLSSPDPKQTPTAPPRQPASAA